MSAAPSDMEEMDRIDAQASEWLVRIEEQGLDRDGERDFDDWCAADPRHHAAYEELRRTWNEIPGLTHLGDLAPLATETTKAPPPARRWPRFAAAGLAAVAAALVALLFVPAEFWRPAPQYRTQIAETRIVTLPDGSSVTLGAKTMIALRFSETERKVLLTGGEAFFDVVHDRARPFLVEAGTSIVRDIGTKFNVNLSQGSVRISVLEGEVAVSRSDAPEDAGLRHLKAGERTELALTPPTAAAPSSAPVVAIPPAVLPSAQPPGAWREGRLVFDNVRLADLADDVNRYYAPGVRVAGDVQDVRVTASFKTSEIPAFMTSLAESFPVSATRGDGGSFVVRAKAR